MDTNFWHDMSKGQQVAAGGGLAALIAAFLPWYVLKDQFIDSVSIRGTEFVFGWMGMVLLIAAAAITVGPAFGKDLGTLLAKDKVAGEQIAIVAAAVGSLLWVIRFVQVPALFFSTMGRGFGLFVALVAAAAVTTGVVMTMKEKGIPMPNADTVAALRADKIPAVPMAPHAAPVPQAPISQAPVPQAPVNPAPAPQTPATQANEMPDGRF